MAAPAPVAPDGVAAAAPAAAETGARADDPATPRRRPPRRRGPRPAAEETAAAQDGSAPLAADATAAGDSGHPAEADLDRERADAPATAAAPALEPADPVGAVDPAEDGAADGPGAAPALAAGAPGAVVPEAAAAAAETSSRPRRQRPPRRAGRGKREAPPAPEKAAAADGDDTAQAVLAVLAATPLPAAPVAEPVADAPPPAPTAPAPTGPAHSAVTLAGDDRHRLLWQPGHACPPALRQAAQQRLDGRGHLDAADDAALPTLLRLAAEAHHPLQVDEAVWAHLAAHRDARTRLAVLEAAYPDGAASAVWQGLLRAPLAPFQAEGALFAVVAGRALIADERGLGKGVMAIAAARLWQRHFGVRRVLVLCAADQRAAWRRAWVRFAGPGAEAPQLMDGGLHQRQALWSTAAGVRILSPEALDSDAAHLAQWAPDLVIVDEPQRLALRDEAWRALAAPHALVLCGAALAEQPALMHTLVAWLDVQRLGPLAALNELQQAADAGRGLAEADVERLSADLSRLMLQRLRADVADQLPPLVHTERLLPLAPGQREAHERHFALAQRLVDGWQASGYLSDSDQWTLAVALREAQRCAHRAEPGDPGSALAEATVQALAAQLADWAEAADGGAPRVAVLCASEPDRAQLAQRLGERGLLDDDGNPSRVQLVGPGAPLPDAVDAVLQVGVPWRPRRQPLGSRDGAAPGQQWIYLVALDSLDTGLFDTLAQRADAPRGLADGGGRAYLQGERLAEWLGLVAAALAATAASR